MIGTFTTKTALGPKVRWNRFKEPRKVSANVIRGNYLRAARTDAERIDRQCTLHRLSLTVDLVEDPARRELMEELDTDEKLERLLAALPMAVPEGMEGFEKAIDGLASRYDVHTTRLHGRAGRPTAIAVGEQVYVRPIAGVTHAALTFEDGFVFFAWRPTKDDLPNTVWANAPTYAVVFAPDGTAEEFRIPSVSGPLLRVAGGKMFSVRPFNWRVPDVTSVGIDDEVVGVWDGIEGPRFAAIESVIGTHDGVFSIGCKERRPWPDHSIDVLVRHPDDVWFENSDGARLWFQCSTTPDADPIKKTVHCPRHRLLKGTDGSLIWAVKDDEGLVTVYRNREPVVSGDMIAFHQDDHGAVTVIERTTNNGRRIHAL